MNHLPKEKQIQIVSSLVEGNSLRATARMCDVAFNTVLKLIPEIGAARLELYQDKVLRNLTSKRIQCDEIWSFVGAKEKKCESKMRRFTRLTNAFRKKAEITCGLLRFTICTTIFAECIRHCAVTPAMEAGIADQFGR
jgi:hypothetical protein